MTPTTKYDLQTIVEIMQMMIEPRYLTSYLNNFYLRLPADNHEHGSYHADLLAKIRAIDSTPLERGWDGDEDKKRGSSDFFLNQTGREYLENINKALIEASLSLEHIKELQKLAREDFKYISELHEYVLPAYIHLRMLGYSHFDLTG